MPLKVGLCATESSGDILGSDLIRNLKSKDGENIRILLHLMNKDKSLSLLETG